MLSAFGGIFVATWVAAALIGMTRITQAVLHGRPTWIILLAGAQALAYSGYTLSYRPLFGLHLSEAARRACYGFSPLATRGGFYYDATSGHSRGKQKARLLGVAEMSVLAPVACAVAWYAWAAGIRLPSSLTLPWAIGVPTGSALAFWLVRWQLRPTARLRHHLQELLQEFGSLSLGQWAVLVAGLALYWTGEIVSLFAALQLFSVTITVPALLIAYSTGYVLTRRNLPAAYIWLPVLLLLFSLHWVGVPYATSLLATYSYLVISLLLPLIYLGLHQLLTTRPARSPS